MPQFRITAPDGSTYNVTGPDGSTEQDALAQVQAQHQASAPVTQAGGADAQPAVPSMPMTGRFGAVKPTWGQQLQASPIGEIGYGLKMGLQGPAQLGLHAAADISGNPTLQNITQRGDAGMAQDTRYQQLARALMETDKMPAWANPGEMIGEGAAQAPLAMLGLPGGALGGAIFGATSPVKDAGGNFWGQKALQTGTAAVLGKVADYASRPPTPPQDKARDLVVRALERDKIAPDNAVDTLARYPDKSTTLMESGGSNVQRLARNVATLPGEGSEQVSRFLSERQANQHARVIDDINAHLSAGGDPYDLAKQLIEQRSKAASPLYEQAYAANKNIEAPEVDKILETPAGRSALKAAREMMMNDRKLMGVPDAELRLQALEGGTPVPKGGVASGLKLETLDYVKKALDDQTSAAIRAGEDRKAGVLSGLTKDFRKALDAADITARTGPNSTKAAGGLYAQARAAFSGPSQSISALEDGKAFLKINSASELTDKLNELSASDKDFFRIGAAAALRDKVSGAGDSHDAVSRVFGNQRLRDQITAVFGKGSVDKFAESMGAERMATATNRFVTGGSNTANKLADVQDQTLPQQMAEGFVQGGVRGAIRKPLMDRTRAGISAYFNGMTPDVRSQLAEVLTRTAPQTGPSWAQSPNATSLAQLLAGGNTRAIAPPANQAGTMTAAALARLLTSP